MAYSMALFSLLTVIFINNGVYGMTGGQYSPLSGYGTKATTAPFGNIDQAFDIVQLAKGSGATFVARTTTYHVTSMVRIFKKAIMHKGFSVVEVITQCPTYFGRKNKLGDAAAMMKSYKENTTPIGSKAKEKRPELIERGVFVEEERPEYCDEYMKIIKNVCKRQ